MKVTKSKRFAFQLVPRVRRIGETGGGLLLILQTPTTNIRSEPPEQMQARAKAKGYKNGTKYNGLASQLEYMEMLPTPDAAMHKTGYMGSNLEGKQVNTDTALREATGGANTGLKLQPAFAFWMMGYPEDWTLLPFLLDPNTHLENGEKNPSKPPETPYSPKYHTPSSKL
jgi:hypothetical protein